MFAWQVEGPGFKPQCQQKERSGKKERKRKGRERSKGGGKEETGKEGKENERERKRRGGKEGRKERIKRKQCNAEGKFGKTDLQNNLKFRKAGGKHCLWYQFSGLQQIHNSRGPPCPPVWCELKMQMFALMSTLQANLLHAARSWKVGFPRSLLSLVYNKHRSLHWPGESQSWDHAFRCWSRKVSSSKPVWDKLWVPVSKASNKVKWDISGHHPWFFSFAWSMWKKSRRVSDFHRLIPYAFWLSLRSNWTGS